MKISFTSWLWLLGSIASYSLGEFFSKKIAEKFSTTNLILVVIFYAGSGLFWIPAMIQRNSLIVLGFIWTILACISTIAIGLGMGETLNTPQTIGVILGIIGLLLMSM